MDSSEMKYRLQALRLGTDDGAFTDDEKTFIDEAYRSVMGCGVRVCNCRNRYTDAVLELFAVLKIRRKSMGRYHLNAGVVIFHESEYYTNHSLTDDVAEAYLRKHPDAFAQFGLTEAPLFDEEQHDDAPKTDDADETPTKTGRKTKK